MDQKMFCFQCEQTAGCAACTGRAGVCGKTADVADAQDGLTGAMVALARTCQTAGAVGENTYKLLVDGLFTTVTNVNFDEVSVQELTDAVRAETASVAAAGNCSPEADYDMEALWGDDEDLRSLKSLVLLGLRGVAAYAYHARVLGKRDEKVHGPEYPHCQSPFLRTGAALGEFELLLLFFRKRHQARFSCCSWPHGPKWSIKRILLLRLVLSDTLRD